MAITRVKGSLIADGTISSSDIQSNIAFDNITSKTPNANLVLTANGSGSVKVDADLVVVGNVAFNSSNFNAVLFTNSIIFGGS